MLPFRLGLKRFPAIASACALALAGLLPVAASAQVTGISNLGQTASSSIDVGQEPNLDTFAQGFSFTTGATAMNLLHVHLQFEAASAGGLTGFSFSLYSGFSASGPTGQLATFTGSPAPATQGTFTYSPASTTMLSASTTYWLVATAPTLSIAGEHFHISTTSATAEDSGGLAGWVIGDTRWQSDITGGGTWSNLGGDVPQFGLTVSAIPEPSTYALVLGTAGLGTVLLRRRRGAGRV
jgi:hypothetical protein